MLENVRIRLNGLMTLIPRRKRKVMYTDFEDEIGEGQAVSLAGFDGGPNYERFLRKVRVYVLEHKDHLSLRKVYNNFPLTDTDIDDLRRIMQEAGGTPEDEARAAREAGGFGVFIRSLVGLDRNAAKEAFAEFLGGKQFNATQIEFINRPMYLYRIHDQSISQARRLDQIRASQHAIEKAIVRRGLSDQLELQVQLIGRFKLRRKSAAAQTPEEI